MIPSEEQPRTTISLSPMRKVIIGLPLLLAISLIPAYSAAPPKAGSVCSKQGATQIYQSKKFTCIKSGKKLVWDKGVVIKTPTTTLTPTPTASPSINSIREDLLGKGCQNEGEEKTTFNIFVCFRTEDRGLIWLKKGSEPTNVKPSISPSTIPDQRPTPSPEPGESSQKTPSPTPNNSNQTLLVSESIDNCKILDARRRTFQPNNVGFPLTKDIIPNSGVVKMVFIPVDFADARGTSDPYVSSNATFTKMKDWYSYFSNGKITLEAQQSHVWFHSSSLSSSYPNLHTSNNEFANTLAQEWINLAGDNFDFSDVKAIFFDFPSTVKGFGEGTQGRADAGGKGIALNTKQGQIRVFFNMTGDYWFKDDAGASAEAKQNYQWSYYIHELLHSQGVANHAPGNGMPIGIGQAQTPGPQGFSGVMSTWQLFLLDWLNLDQIFCSRIESLNSGYLKLTPLDEKRYGIKMAIIALTPTTALVIESRRPVDWSADMLKEASGLIVYLVDTTLDNDRSKESSGDTGNQPEYSKWAYLRLPDGVSGGYSIRRNFTDYFLKPGQSVTFQQIKITLTTSDKDDLIRVEKTN